MCLSVTCARQSCEAVATVTRWAMTGWDVIMGCQTQSCNYVVWHFLCLLLPFFLSAVEAVGEVVAEKTVEAVEWGSLWQFPPHPLPVWAKVSSSSCQKYNTAHHFLFKGIWIYYSKLDSVVHTEAAIKDPKGKCHLNAYTGHLHCQRQLHNQVGHNITVHY